MKKIKYKLIVSDFDGTLLTDTQTIPERVKRAINEYVSSGGIFVVSTGRMVKSILPHLHRLGLKGFVSAYQGTAIVDIESGKPIRWGGLSAAEAIKACLEYEKAGASVNAYSDEILFTSLPEGNEFLNIYQRITGVQAEHIDCEKMSDFIARRGGAYQKLTSLNLPKDCDSLYKTMQKALGGEFDITRSSSVLCEVSPLGDNKGESLKFIAEKYGVPLNQSVAIGDNLNDIPMIKAAGLGVAVRNADKEAKKAASFIAPSNNDGGVGFVIENFGFEND